MTLYRYGGRWKLVTNSRAWGSNLLWHLIHHLPCPVHSLCFRTVPLGLANNGAPNEIRKQNHDAPNFVKMIVNRQALW